MTPSATLPRRSRPFIRALAVVPVLALLALTGCSGGDEPGSATDASSSSTSAGPAEGATDPATDPAGGGGPTDTYTDSPVPTTVDVPVEDLPGFEEIRFWEGDDDLLEGPRMVTGGLVVDEGELAVQVAALEEILSEETSQAQLRNWIRYNSFSEERAVVLDPVVVDGEEMLRARGSSGLQLYDYFVRLSDTGEALSVFFSLPKALSETEREEYIGSVLSTVEFE